MEESVSTRKTLNCPHHFHTNDPIFVKEEQPRVTSGLLEEQQIASSERHTSGSAFTLKKRTVGGCQNGGIDHGQVSKEHGLRRIIRNFTPS
jgi:hypothetical protein